VSTLSGVHLLVGKQTGVVSAYEHLADAEARRDKFNADPWIEPGTPDPDAPYEVQSIGVEAAS
jgi:hypothetical protein